MVNETQAPEQEPEQEPVAPPPFTSGSAYHAWLDAGAVPGTEAEYE